MKNALLYMITVLVWGSTWLAIEYQLGDVAVEISLIYRFGMAGLLMWGYCLIRGIPVRFSRREHGFIALLAMCNFSLNYAILYWAQTHISSAMASVAFSTLLLMNIINTRLFFGTEMLARIYIGALIGLAGIVALFWQGLYALDASENMLFGLALALSGALIASFGNMVSVRNSKHGMNVFAVNAWGMLYGTLVLVLIAWISGAEYVRPPNMAYLISLIYLTVFGTVIAFASYYVLLRDMGPARASYVIVLFPVVAVALSSFFEGFVWTTHIALGFSLVLLGNAIVLTPAHTLSTLTRRLRS